MLLSIILVTRNEEEHIEKCIISIVDNLKKISHSEFEFILVDSGSTDRTISIAEEKLDEFGLSYKIYINSGKTLAKGWNIGIKKAVGKYVFRIDAHSILHEGYLELGLKKLESDATIHAVGGVLNTQVVPRSMKTNAIKCFLTSLVGVGNSNFRVGKQSGMFDTVLYAIYRKSIFDENGLFREELHRHEDTEMHERLRRAGVKLFTYHKMVATYFGRNTIRGLARQMFMNGYYSHEVGAIGSSGLQLRHHIPGVFYGLLLLTLFLSLLKYFFIKIFLLFICLYVSAIFIVSAFTRKTRFLMAIPDTMVTVFGHASYALGYLIGFKGRWS